MNDISDISGRTDFIRNTLINCNTLLRLLYDVDDAKHVREDIEYSLHDIEEIYERYDTLANRIITQQSVHRDMCKERLDFQDQIRELQEKLCIVNNGKRTGIRNVALRVFKNKEPKRTSYINDTDKMIVIDMMNNNQGFIK